MRDAREVLRQIQSRIDSGRPWTAGDAYDIPRLVAALRAVLDLHKPQEWALGRVCRECDRVYPCPTERAITEALGGTDG